MVGYFLSFIQRDQHETEIPKSLQPGYGEDILNLYIILCMYLLGTILSSIYPFSAMHNDRLPVTCFVSVNLYNVICMLTL